MIIFAIAVIFALVSAVLYVSIGQNTATPSPAAIKVAELAKITFAASMFAIMFSLTLGLHDAFVRVVK
jgi:hypothetical protein